MVINSHFFGWFVEFQLDGCFQRMDHFSKTMFDHMCFHKAHFDSTKPQFRCYSSEMNIRKRNSFLNDGFIKGIFDLAPSVS
jgi:hypothetical protein